MKHTHSYIYITCDPHLPHNVPLILYVEYTPGQDAADADGQSHCAGQIAHKLPFVAASSSPDGSSPPVHQCPMPLIVNVLGEYALHQGSSHATRQELVV